MTRGSVSVHADARAPVDKPPFTIGTLRKAIPAHCFDRSLLRSSGYLLADLLLAGALFAFSQWIDTRASLPVALVAWPLYWFFQVSSQPP